MKNFTVAKCAKCEIRKYVYTIDSLQPSNDIVLASSRPYWWISKKKLWLFSSYDPIHSFIPVWPGGLPVPVIAQLRSVMSLVVVLCFFQKHALFDRRYLKMIHSLKMVEDFQSILIILLKKMNNGKPN